jgi:predicted transcriptional regulator
VAVATRVSALVRSHPGIHFRDLGRRAAVRSNGQLRHHLDQLQRAGRIVEVADGRFRRYFPAGAADWHLLPTLARTSRPLAQRLLLAILERPRDRTGLRRDLGCAESTLGYHLARLVRSGDLVRTVEHGRILYALAEPADGLRAALARQAGAATPSPSPPSPASLPGLASPLLARHALVADDLMAV